MMYYEVQIQQQRKNIEYFHIAQTTDKKQKEHRRQKNVQHTNQQHNSTVTCRNIIREYQRKKRPLTLGLQPRLES